MYLSEFDKLAAVYVLDYIQYKYVKKMRPYIGECVWKYIILVRHLTCFTFLFRLHENEG